jgi:hypothetical protein
MLGVLLATEFYRLKKGYSKHSSWMGGRSWKHGKKKPIYRVNTILELQADPKRSLNLPPACFYLLKHCVPGQKFDIFSLPLETLLLIVSNKLM